MTTPTERPSHAFRAKQTPSAVSLVTTARNAWTNFGSTSAALKLGRVFAIGAARKQLICGTRETMTREWLGRYIGFVGAASNEYEKRLKRNYAIATTMMTAGMTRVMSAMKSLAVRSMTLCQMSPGQR
jgi:hypothetical protein